MQMKTVKKNWKKPKLVVLYRGKPEESVLSACKADIGGAVGPERNRCKIPPGQGGGYCSVLAPS